MDEQLLTQDEHAVVQLLARAWNAFLELPQEHPDDVAEFRAAIHRAQEKVVSRPARREKNESEPQQDFTGLKLEINGGAITPSECPQIEQDIILTVSGTARKIRGKWLVELRETKSLINKELEACAQLCENIAAEYMDDGGPARDCALMITARIKK